MPKDPTKNVDRYKIRGGQLNAFEFHQNQGAVSQQQHDHGDQMSGPADGTGLPPDRAKAERTRKLLAEHGEIMPEPMERNEMAQQEGDNMANRVQAGSQKEDSEMMNEDFAPTHGRSPEVIREMIQSRRATDEVPDPEDIAAGRQKSSRQKKEHGITSARTGSRKATVRSSGQSTRRSSTATASQRGGEPAKGTRSTGDAAGSRGKQAALRASTNRTIKTETAKAGGKSTPPRKGSAQSTTQKNGESATKRTPAQSGKQSPKRASSQSEGKQNATRTTAKQSAARTSANQKSAPSRKTANGKTARAANKTGRAATAKTRNSAKTQVKASGNKRGGTGR